MKEYSFDTTVNYPNTDKELNVSGWYPSIDTCLVAVRKIMEEEENAVSFVFSIVQRNHRGG